MDSPRRSDREKRLQTGAQTGRVLICDDNEQRRERVIEAMKVVSNLVVVDSSALPLARQASIALVGITCDPFQSEICLQRIKACKAAGLEVLAYAIGADAWPVTLRCRPLIAGAAKFIGAYEAEFDLRLSAALAAMGASLAARFAEHEHLRNRLRALGVEGAGPSMLQVFRQVLKFGALSDLPVLVTGETGTGKERITRALHQCDPKRAAGPFVAVNCGALVSSLAESELFGHRKGAFTGAERARIGLVRAADRGVLFLDEIGELDLALQTKLLRVLQEGQVLGVGEEHEVAVDVRVVAATHRDLHALVAAGRFRADLLHRLCVLPLHLSPLRERREDIPLLVEYFLKRNRSGFQTLSESVSLEYFEALSLLQFPGNIRQLENILRQSFVNKKETGPLSLADLPADVLAELGAVEAEIPASEDVPAQGALSGFPVSGETLQSVLCKLAEAHSWKLDHCMHMCEREMVSAALSRTEGNQTKAASLLGVTSRCVYNKIRKLGLTT